MKLEKEMAVIVIILVFMLAVFFVNNPTITSYTVLDEVNIMISNANIKFSNINSNYPDFLANNNMFLDSLKLDEFQARLSTITTEEEASALKAEVNAFLDPLPKSISQKSVLKDTQILEPKDPVKT